MFREKMRDGTTRISSANVPAHTHPAPVVPTPAGISVYKTTAQSNPAGLTTLVSFNAVRYAGTGGLVLDSGTITVPEDGWYQVNGCVTFAASTSSARRILLLGVGSSPGILSSYVSADSIASAQDSANVSILSTAATVKLAAGDVVGLAVNVPINYALEVGQTYMNNLSAHLIR